MSQKLILLCFWMLSVKAMAQVNLDSCRQWARENYPEVKRLGIIDATEECNLSNASRNWLPAVTLSAQGGWMSNVLDINDLLVNANHEQAQQIFHTITQNLGIKSMSHWQYSAGVDVVQPIYDGGATALQRDLARKQAVADRAKIEVSLNTLDEKVIEVYFAILLLEERRQQATMRSELLDKNLEKLRQLEKEGVAKLNDVQMVEVEQLKLQQACDMLDENIAVYRTTMSLLTYHNLAVESFVRPEMPDAERPDFGTLPEMQFLETQRELLNLKYRYEKVKMRPKIGFMAQVRYGYPGTNIFRGLTQRSPQFNLGLGVKVSWDIAPFYKHKNNLELIRQDQATIDNHRELLLFRQRIGNVSLEKHVQRLATIREQDDRIVSLREKLRIAEETKLENDYVDATELLAKINDESEARLLRTIHETEILRDTYKLMHNGKIIDN